MPRYRVSPGAAPPATAFSDTFTRPNKSTIGSTDWIRTLVNNPGGAGNGATAAAIVSGNTCLVTSVAGAAPANNYQPGWVPAPVYQSLYNKRGVFVQCTFVAAAGAGSGLMLRYNHDLNSTTTEDEGADYYVMPFNGRIDKRVGGGAQVVIGAATWVVAANDVIRFEVLTAADSLSLQLQTIRNGSILQTITDNTGTRILSGVPGFIMYSISATGQTFQFKNFSCGLISALST